MALRAGKRRKEPLRADPVEERSDEGDAIDLRDDAPVEGDDATPIDAHELYERFRARAAQAEAERELIRLRARHWSGERLIEEGYAEAEWWEHPDADPYAVLGIIPGASLDDASRARRRIARECHPDRLADNPKADQAIRRMVAANAAYDRLRRALLRVEL